MTDADAPAAGSPRPFPLAAAGGLALVLAAYANHFAGGFHFDDTHVIQQNLYLRSLGNLPRFFTDASTFSSLPANATYRPLLSATYALDYAIGGGLVSWSFHVTQFLIHVAVGVCVFLLIGAVLDRAAPSPANRWAALAGATLFAVHTANTETVNYLSSRSDELSTLGLLAGFLVYATSPRARRFQLHVVPMWIGALAKPPAVLLGPLLLLYALLIEEGLSLGDVVRLRSPARIRAAALRAAPTIALGALAFLFVEGMNPPTQTYAGPPRVIYLRTQLWVWLRYLRLFFLPVGLTADTDLRPIVAAADPRVLVGAAAALLVLAAAWVLSRGERGRVAALGILWFFVGLLPSSSIVPLAEMTNEHRVYLPFVGLALVAAVALVAGGVRIAATARVAATEAPAPGRTRALTAVVVAILLAHAVGTSVRNRVWRSEETLWADVVRKSPGNGRAWMNYGLTQMQAGRYDRALELFRESARRDPAYAYVHTNLGIVLDALGRTAEAEPEFRAALGYQPNFVEGHFFFARWLATHGRGAEALDHARRATELSPGHGPARALTLDLLYVMGRRGELYDAAQAALAVLPTDAQALAYADGAPPLTSSSPAALDSIAAERAAAGDLVAAAVARRRAAQLSPTPETARALALALERLGFTREARAALER